MSEPTVEFFKNGPIFVKGPMKFVDNAGVERLIERANIALCRCGQSDEKPFCDGSHNDEGFQADEANLFADA